MNRSSGSRRTCATWQSAATPHATSTVFQQPASSSPGEQRIAAHDDHMPQR